MAPVRCRRAAGLPAAGSFGMGRSFRGPVPKRRVRFFVSRENLRGVSIPTRPTMPTKKKATDDEKRAMGIPRAIPWRGAQRYVKKVTPLKNGKVRVSRHPISLQFELQRRGVLYGAPTADEAARRGPIVAAGRLAVAGAVAAGGKAVRSQKMYEEHIAKMEAFVKYALPDDDPERKRLESIEEAIFGAWDRDHPGQDAPAYVEGSKETPQLSYVVDKPFNKDSALAFAHCMLAPGTAKFDSESKLGPYAGKTWVGRQCLYPSLERMLSAQRTLDHNLAGKSELQDQDVRHFAASVHAQYNPEQAVAFDIETGLRKLRRAIKQDTLEDDPENERPNPFRTGLQRDLVWTLLLTSCATVARASLFTEFAPLISQIEFPETTDGEGHHAYYILTLTHWKHNDGKKTQRLQIRRNQLNPEFCPVLAMELWLKTLHDMGIHDGPIFPALTPWGDKVLRDEDGVANQRLHVDRWSNWIRSAFKRCGGELADCTSHSIRRSVVMWAARCGASMNAVFAAGRWVEMSQRFNSYFGEGRIVSEEMLSSKAEDPIKRFWMWKPITFEMAPAA